MATTKLSAADFVKIGYGQVEPNHLSAQRTGQIYAQLPAAEDITVLENGQFAKYNYAAGVVNFDADKGGEWMLVYNEVKVYDEKAQQDHDFAMIKGNYHARVFAPVDYENLTDGGKGRMMPENTAMVPRLFKTNVGDIFTTNTVAETALAVGDVLTPNAQGYLAKGEGEMKWEVVKVYTMPDGQPGVKIVRIA